MISCGNPDLAPTREEVEEALAAEPAERVVAVPGGRTTTLGHLAHAVARRFEPGGDRAQCAFCGQVGRAAGMVLLTRDSMVEEHRGVRWRNMAPKRIAAGERVCWIHFVSAIRGITPEGGDVA